MRATRPGIAADNGVSRSAVTRKLADVSAGAAACAAGNIMHRSSATRGTARYVDFTRNYRPSSAAAVAGAALAACSSPITESVAASASAETAGVEAWSGR